jgi:hypothetical protein
MRRPFSYLLILIGVIVIIGLSDISLDEEEIKNTQTKITCIYVKYTSIGIKEDGLDRIIDIQDDTKITKGGKEISFSALSIEDIVEISYVQKGGFLRFGGTYSAKTIKVLEKNLPNDSDL